MDMNTQDCLKKALLDTQERVRDFVTYSNHIPDKKLSYYFKAYAEMEGKQARQLQEFLNEAGR